MITVFNKAVRSKLAATAAITDLVSSRIYADVAENDAALPYIVYSMNSGRERERIWRLEERVIIYNVMAVSDEDAGLQKAATVADAIYAALHLQTLTFDPGWEFYECRVQEPFKYSDIVAQRKFMYAGVLVRIEADYQR
jgi:hypothetical protein